jgi:simple sugar transport system ATP-binding protein
MGVSRSSDGDVTLSLKNVSKRYGPVVALRDVSFDVSPGQVHALLGENGAGKSTLMHIAYGMLRPDTGTITVGSTDGSVIITSGFLSPRAARTAGIGMVHQHFTSIPALTIGENIALTAGWTETGRAAERRAKELVTQLGLPMPVLEYAESLSVQLRQRLEIAKALAANGRILLLDEPTAVLAPREVDELLRFVRGFAHGGGAVVLITHKLDEVMRVADRVTVLRRGEVILSDAIVQQTRRSLSRAMIGVDLPPVVRQPARAGDVLVRARGLNLKRHGATTGRPEIQDASFEFRAGQVVGVAAIEGNGQRELLRAIAGVDRVGVVAGTLEVTGPVAFIPEDRTTEGLIPPFTLAENLLLGTLTSAPRWLDWGAIGARANELLGAHDIRATGPDVVAATLSGGNQQKFVLARAMAGAPRVIVAEDPTRGLDVQAAEAIHERLRDAARRGAAVIVHASDLDEVLALADRILVVAGGRLHELSRDTPRDVVGDAMLALEPAA